jgi:hypothetical protein
LSPENGFLGVEPQRDVVHRNIKRVLTNIGRLGVAGKRMIVSNEIEAGVVCLQLQVLARRTKEVAYMQAPGRLYTRKNSQINL